MSDGYRAIGTQSIKFLNRPSGEGQKTVLVLGCGRGGTSAMAGALRELGVVMPNAHPLKHEWSPLIRKQDGGVDIVRSVQAIEQLNDAYDIWGWKSPKDIFVVDHVQAHLRNPVLVIIIRNFAATCISAGRHENIPWQLTVPAYANVVAEIARILSYSTLPIAVVEYESLCSKPRPIITEIDRWLGLSAPKEKLQIAKDFINTGTYRSISTEPHSGVFNEEELLRDSAASQNVLYAKAAQMLSGAHVAIEDDLKCAERIIEHLGRQLSMETDFETVWAEFQRSTPPVPTVVEVTAVAPEAAAPIAVQIAQYKSLLIAYEMVVKKRMEAQRLLDLLGILAERRQSSNASPEHVPVE